MRFNEFYTAAQELWEAEDNATQLHEEVAKFYFRLIRNMRGLK